MIEMNKDDYYVIPATGQSETIHLHKVKSAPAFFRGCFDYCYKSELATIYKDVFSNWSILILFSDEIAEPFLDWANVNFDLLNSPAHSTEHAWEEGAKEYLDKGFQLIILRGSFDIYCLLKYFVTCHEEEPEWLDIYNKISLEFSSKVV